MTLATMPEPRVAPSDGRRPDPPTLHGGGGDAPLPIPRFSEYATVGAGVPAAAVRREVRPPKRPKGRLFVGGILLTVCGLLGFKVWDAYLRFGAYGVVEGHIVAVVPPWTGEVQHVHVREGDRVQQGQLLLSLENPGLRHQLARLDDDLRHAKATLSAETARLHLHAQMDSEERQKAVAEYYAAWGDLLNERAQLEIAKRRLERARDLKAKRAIAHEELESAEFTEAGQRQKVEKLETAIQELRRRAESVAGPAAEPMKQLEPHVIRIESLQAEAARCAEQLALGQVRAPVSGVVLKRECLAGDHAPASRPVVTLLAEGSVQVALYLAQDDAASLSSGDQIELVAEPYPERALCEVVRVGERFEPAPPGIQRYYRSNEPLLPVYLRPTSSADQRLLLRVGGVVALPRGWRSTKTLAQNTGE